uniref:Uncharacterized protein n=1 Tax=Cacopsylla melanoneura TaxID=428564 RepID=A0A8D8VCN0_9HEMI
MMISYDLILCLTATIIGLISLNQALYGAEYHTGLRFRVGFRIEFFHLIFVLFFIRLINIISNEFETKNNQELNLKTEPKKPNFIFNFLPSFNENFTNNNG